MKTYETSFIDALKQCDHCTKSFDKYFDPRVLPCCNKTLCSHCVESIEKETRKDRYKCISCGNESLMPVNGFPVNTTVVKLLSEEPKELYRGKEYEDFKSNLIMLANLNKNLLFEQKLVCSLLILLISEMLMFEYIFLRYVISALSSSRSLIGFIERGSITYFSLNL